MKEIQLAKSEASFQILDQWHERFEDALTYDVETQRVSTSFGFTDVVVAGSTDATSLQGTQQSNPTGETATTNLPVVVLHGAMAGAPFALRELADLPVQRRMLAVNIPGQSTRAAQVRLDFRTDEYGRWFDEVLAELGVGRVILCGVSWGGSVALQVAKHFPQRIAGLVLVVPAAIVRGPIVAGFLGMGLPMLRYKIFPHDKNRERALEGIFTNHDPLWNPYLGDALRHWSVDFSVPPLMSPQDLDSFTAPVFVIAADRDICFPGKRLLRRSEKLFPNLVGTELLEDTKHCPSFQDADRARFAQRLDAAIERVSGQAS